MLDEPHCNLAFGFQNSSGVEEKNFVEFFIIVNKLVISGCMEECAYGMYSHLCSPLVNNIFYALINQTKNARCSRDVPSL